MPFPATGRSILLIPMLQPPHFFHIALSPSETAAVGLWNCPSSHIITLALSHSWGCILGLLYHLQPSVTLSPLPPIQSSSSTPVRCTQERDAVCVALHPYDAHTIHKRGMRSVLLLALHPYDAQTIHRRGMRSVVCFCSMLLELEPRTSCMLGKCSITELQSRSLGRS